MATNTQGDDAEAAGAAADDDAAVAEQPFHERYPGVSAEQFAAWREAFDARVEGGKHRNLKKQAELDVIKDLLQRWDQLNHAERRGISASAGHWKTKYKLGSDGLLLTSEGKSLLLLLLHRHAIVGAATFAN
jgi:hypothetical protein|eukprot:COSAG01_NODE_9508_length_2426_cov_3.901590_3_plen_132_part_00